MSFLTVLPMAISLALDAMAVSVANGMSSGKSRYKDALLMGIFFGTFQFLMPLLGFYLGRGVLSFIAVIDNYIAFVILSVIGIKMITEAIKNKDNEESVEKLTVKVLTIQAIATSIDAFAVGISIANSCDNLYFVCSVIGIVAFLLSVIGALAGKKLGGLFEKYSQITGGSVLVLIGLKFLIEQFIK